MGNLLVSRFSFSKTRSRAMEKKKARTLLGSIKSKTQKKTNDESTSDNKTDESTPDNKIGLSLLTTFTPDQTVQIDEPSPIFPPEVIIQILSHLPLKALTKLQLVCKEWRAWIFDHYFTKEYLDHGSVAHYWYNVEYGTVQNTPGYDSFTYIDCCDGLVIMNNYTAEKYNLWNPATRLTLELPDPQAGRLGMIISFVPSTRSYRIVSIFKDKKSGGEGCEVLTPGDKEWRRLEFPVRVGVKERVSVVASGGGVHCVLVTKVGIKTDVEIVSLNLETEKFTVCHLPKLGLFDGWNNFWDVDWEGKLAVADIVGQNIELLELEDYKKQRWCEKKVIRLPFLKQDGYGVGNVIPLFARKGEMWFWLKGKKIFTCAAQTGKLADIMVSKTFSPSSKIYPYKPSLTTFEGMVPDTKLERLRCHFK